MKKYISIFALIYLLPACSMITKKKGAREIASINEISTTTGCLKALPVPCTICRSNFESKEYVCSYALNDKGEVILQKITGEIPYTGYDIYERLRELKRIGVCSKESKIVW